MDSDDLSLPNRFEAQLKVFEENPEVSVVGGWISEFDNDPDVYKRQIHTRMKIAICNVQEFNPTIGGIERVSVSLAEGLIKEGVEAVSYTHLLQFDHIGQNVVRFCQWHNIRQYVRVVSRNTV